MDKPLIETSFLITEEDFVNMSLTKKNSDTPKENKFILKILGFLSVLCGVAAYIFIGGNIYQIICWIMLILTGLFSLFYYDVISPSMLIKSARHFYSFNKSAICSKTVRFYEDSFEIKSDNYKLSIPKKYIYKIVESKSTMIIFLDKSEFCFIPLRVLSDKELETLHNIYLAQSS